MTAKAIDTTGQNDFWHYAVGSDRKGPVPRPTLAKLLASGEISAETYVWQPGMENWVHLGDAPPLKALVAGIEGDSGPEDFVEEDTAFTSADELRASHKQLDHEDGGLSTDTVIEPAPAANTIIMGSKTKPATEPRMTAAPVAAAPVAAAPAAAVAKRPSEVNLPAAKPIADDDLFGASAAPAPRAASAGDDLFTSAASSNATADIFGVSSPTAEDENIAGVHGRRQSSVLFTLDELGREDGKKPGGSGDAAFVTDSSGLIDIKAVATSHKPVGADDPFGGSGAGLVMPPRPTSTGAMAIPIVPRRRGMGPWILAAVALLVGGGVALAFILSGNKEKDPQPSGPPVVAGQQVPKEASPQGDPPKVAGVDPKVAEPVKQPEPDKKPDPVVAEKPADPTTNPAGTNPVVMTPPEKKPDPKKPDPKKPPEKIAEVKPPDPVVTAPPDKKPPTENTEKVSGILEKLQDKPQDKPVDKTKPDDSLPDKLSAAVVRNTIKGKFGSCAAMVTTGGPVSVTTSFVIANSGVVQSARITDAAGVGADVQRCVVGVIKGTTFGKFKESAMTVNLPVKLL